MLTPILTIVKIVYFLRGGV